MNISKGTIYILFGRIAGVLSGFLFVLIVPRVLGPAHMGYYSYWFSIFSILVLIINFGGNQTLQRFVPELLQHNPGQAKTLLRNTALVKLVLCALMCIAVVALFRDTPFIALIISVGACLSSLINLTAQFFYGCKKMAAFSVMVPLNALSRMLCVVGLYMLMGRRGIIAGIVAFSFVYLFVFGIPFLNRYRQCGSTQPCEYGYFLRCGFFLFAGDIAFTVMQRLLVPISKQYVDDMAVIGYLGLAFLIFQTFSTVPKSLALGLLPRVVELLKEREQPVSPLTPQATHAHPSTDALRAIYNETWRYITVIVWPLIAGTLFLIHPAIRLFIGSSYLPAAQICIFFLPSLYFASYMPLNIRFLQAQNRGLFLIVASSCICAAFVALSAAGAAMMGIGGAVMAFAGALFLLWLVLTLSLEEFIDYKSLVLATGKSVLAAAAMGYILWFIPTRGPFLFILNAVAGTVVYFGVLWLVRGITQTDITRLLRAGR